jgi:DNA-binding Lrp family transcriptional regulator
MIQILKIPESVLNKSTAVFTTYNYIIANRYKRSKSIKIRYETLAEQMDINIRHVKNYVKELVDTGVIQVSEPNIKKNGLKGAVTITLIAEDKKYAIVPQDIMLDKTIPKTYRQYYARLKRIIDINTFTTFKSPVKLQQELGCKERTYWESMNFMKNTKIKGQALILDESNGNQYKFIMEYERFVAGNHQNLKDVKQVVRNTKRVSKDEGHSTTI